MQPQEKNELCCRRLIIEVFIEYLFRTVDKREARPSSEPLGRPEKGHRFEEELASEVNGYFIASLQSVLLRKQQWDVT